MDKKREIELKPCPYCGGTEMRVFDKYYSGAIARAYYVICFDCWMKGPELSGSEAAAEAWNNLPRKVESLPNSQLDELEELAGKATPGGWCYEEAFGGFANRWAVIVRRGIHEPGFYSAIAEMVGEERTEDDAAFIAAANPAVVLALIAEVRRHRSAKEEIWT